MECGSREQADPTPRPRPRVLVHRAPITLSFQQPWTRRGAIRRGLRRPVVIDAAGCGGRRRCGVPLRRRQRDQAACGRGADDRRSGANRRRETSAVGPARRAGGSARAGGGASLGAHGATRRGVWGEQAELAENVPGLRLREMRACASKHGTCRPSAGGRMVDMGCYGAVAADRRQALQGERLTRCVLRATGLPSPSCWCGACWDDR
eukprot:366378-Chlamydomonas_euryale.AAC.13